MTPRSPSHLFILMDNLGIGGQQLFNWNIAKYMRDQGWSISTAYPHGRSPERPWQDRWEAFGPCTPLLGSGALRRRSDAVPNIRNVATLVRRFRRDSPDVVLTGSSWTRTVGSTAGLLAGVPVVSLPGSIWIGEPLYKNLARVTGPVHSCEGYISLAEIRAQEYLDLGVEARRIIHSHHGTDLDRFRPKVELRRKMRAALGLPDGVPVLGFAGRLDPVFGLPKAIEVVSRTKRWHLLVIGDGPDRGPIEAVIRARGLGDRVTLTGFVGDPAEYIAAMDCALVSCLDPHRGRFNLGTFCVEALATGMPVLHFVPSEINEGYVEGESGFYIGNDPTLLHRRLVELEANPERLVSMGGHARRHAEANFDRADGLASIARGFDALTSGLWPDGTRRWRPGSMRKRSTF